MILVAAVMWCAIGPIVRADVPATQRTNAPPQTQPVDHALLTIENGDLPIILSAPHGGRTPIPDTPVRTGQNVPRFVVLRDVNTAELAEQLADAIERELGKRPFVVIARFERKFVDANREPRYAYEHATAQAQYEAYHEAIRAASAEIRQRWGRGLLLDLHGQVAAPDAIYRGTRDGKTVSDLLQRSGNEALIGPQSLLGALAAAGYTILPNLPPDGAIGHEQRFNGGHIVAEHGSHQDTAIDAIQLEFGTNLRRSKRLPETASDTARAVAKFTRRYLLDEKKSEE